MHKPPWHSSQAQSDGIKLKVRPPCVCISKIQVTRTTFTFHTSKVQEAKTTFTFFHVFSFLIRFRGRLIELIPRNNFF